MRGQKEVIINIDLNGNCSIEGNGFVGSECTKFLSEIEDALGTVTSHAYKPEYRQRHVERERNTQTGER